MTFHTYGLSIPLIYALAPGVFQAHTCSIVPHPPRRAKNNDRAPDQRGNGETNTALLVFFRQCIHSYLARVVTQQYTGRTASVLGNTSMLSGA